MKASCLFNLMVVPFEVPAYLWSFLVSPVYFLRYIFYVNKYQ
jgi:hypothetical protein